MHLFGVVAAVLALGPQPHAKSPVTIHP